MAAFVAGVVGALVGLVGVVLGAWLTSRREHRRWIRDQQLRAAIDFVGASGDLYGNQRGLKDPPMSAEDEARARNRLQDGRSALYLLCERPTVDLAERLVQHIRRVPRVDDGSHDAEALELLQQLTERLRRELGSTRNPAGTRAH